jgi:raffinose/stachyose/melibiose transport system permease protein
MGVRSVRQRWIGRIIWSLAAVLVIIFFSGPLYLTLTGAFKSTTDIIRTPLSPTHFTLDNMVKIFSDSNHNIWEMYRNSILLTSISVFSVLIVSPMAGYYIARSKKKISVFLTMFFLVGMMVPPQITLVPMMSMFYKLHLVGTLWGVIIVYGLNIFVLILFAKFIITIPIALEESAYIDGASIPVMFFKIVLPLLKPMIATAIIIDGLNTWNDFIQPLFLFKTFKTITYGIYVANSVENADYGYILGFVLLASIPMVILFLFLQKLFIDGLTGGAIKG